MSKALNPRLRPSGATIALLLLLGLIFASGADALPASFGTEGAGAGQISGSPTGITVEQESGDIYVADKENNRIDKFGPEGEFILAFGWGVADGETQALQTCTTKCFAGLGGEAGGSSAGQFSKVEGIAVDNDPLSLSHGDVYVVDAGNQRVQKFDPEGHFLLTFGGAVNASTKGNICRASEAASCRAGVEGTEPGEFSGLTGRSIAVDSSTGTVYVGDRNRVQRFSEEGAVEGPPVTFEDVGRIQSLALDSAKDIYLWGGLQTQENSDSGVHKYDPTGKELGTPRDEAGFEEGLAISIGPGDELFVNDRERPAEGHHHILTFNAEPARGGERISLRIRLDDLIWGERPDPQRQCRHGYERHERQQRDPGSRAHHDLSLSRGGAQRAQQAGGIRDRP
jgi:hypothetical protein